MDCEAVEKQTSKVLSREELRVRLMDLLARTLTPPHEGKGTGRGVSLCRVRQRPTKTCEKFVIKSSFRA
jgi:hypothetical protein